MILETDSARYKIIPELGLLINAELEDEFLQLKPPKLIRERVIANLKKNLSRREIDLRLASIVSITLNLTEDCNFRCKYCAFSGIYDGKRTHAKNRMSFKTARKIVDFFCEFIQDDRRTSKHNSFNIGFYGGEPLLEFQVIKDIMKYSERKLCEEGIGETFTFNFRMTTNGFLLKDKIVDFLANNNVGLDISLDGPEEEHDKFRRTRKGKETWKIIMANLRNMKDKYPDYYRDKVKFLCTLHPLHDFEKIDKFFMNNDEYFDLVSTYFLNETLMNEDIKKAIYNVARDQTSQLNMEALMKRYDNKFKFNVLGYNINFTGMCFPGENKLFIDTNGQFHICERVAMCPSIGSIDKGFDYATINYIWQKWADIIIKNKCWECEFWSICPTCLAGNTDYSIKVDCTFKNSGKKTLLTYLAEKERKSKEGETNVDNVFDYLEKL